MQFIFGSRCEEAEKIDTWKYVFLNVIDREHEGDGVKVWMAPISAWNQIKKEVFSRGDSSLIFDSPDDGTHGCDLSVYYSPDATQYNLRYKVSILQDDPRPLGTEKQEGIWAEQVLPLEPENFFSPVEDEKVILLKSIIEKEVFKEWKKRTKASIKEGICWHPSDHKNRSIGCKLSNALREEGSKLLNMLSNKEAVESKIPEWRERLELEKIVLEKRDKELNEILEADGFKNIGLGTVTYLYAREALVLDQKYYKELVQEDLITEMAKRGMSVHSYNNAEEIKAEIKSRDEQSKKWSEEREKQFEAEVQKLKGKMERGEDILKILKEMVNCTRTSITERLGLGRMPGQWSRKLEEEIRKKN
jgi:hypothetical protein